LHGISRVWLSEQPHPSSTRSHQINFTKGQRRAPGLQAHVTAVADCALIENQCAETSKPARNLPERRR